MHSLQYEPILQLNLIDLAIRYLDFAPTRSVHATAPKKSVHVTPKATAKFIADAVQGIRNPELKQRTINRMRDGLVVDETKDDTAEIEKTWRECETVSCRTSQAEFDKKHVAKLSAIVCDAKHSRATAKEIIRNWFSPEHHRPAFSAQLARGLLGEDGKPCAATQDLDEADINTLRAAMLTDPTTTPEVLRKCPG